MCFNVYLFKLLSVLFPPFWVVPSPLLSASQQVPRLQARAYRIMGHMHAVCVCMRSADLHVACMRYVFAGVQLTSMASLLNSLCENDKGAKKRPQPYDVQKGQHFLVCVHV